MELNEFIEKSTSLIENSERYKFIQLDDNERRIGLSTPFMGVMAEQQWKRVVWDTADAKYALIKKVDQETGDNQYNIFKQAIDSNEKRFVEYISVHMYVSESFIESDIGILSNFITKVSEGVNTGVAISKEESRKTTRLI